MPTVCNTLKEKKCEKKTLPKALMKAKSENNCTFDFGCVASMNLDSIMEKIFTNMEKRNRDNLDK